jgi:hypothetical protein
MNRRHLPLCAIALAVGIVGALAVGVPPSTVMIGLLVLACPLMMLFMHGGHGGGQGSSDTRPSVNDDHDRTGLR